MLLSIYDHRQLQFSAWIEGNVELGRQQADEDGPYARKELQGSTRVIIASREENGISRQHVLLEKVDETRYRLNNLSRTRPILLASKDEVHPGSSIEIQLPALFGIGSKGIRLEAEQTDQHHILSMAGATPLPGTWNQSLATFTQQTPPPIGGTDSTNLDDLMPRLRTIMDVMQSTESENDFFSRAAQAVVDVVGLQTGRVLLWENNKWKEAVLQTAEGFSAPPEGRLSQQVLHHVRKDKAPFIQAPGQEIIATESLREIDAVVAAPILNEQGEVIAVLYGDRSLRSGHGKPPQLSKLEAMLVELLAIGVASGLTRIRQQEAMEKERTQFEQFFTKDLARHLARDPNLLKPRQVDNITLLFCDIRGFSRISRHLGPELTFKWISEVMEALSECVHNEAGVLVDYIGDELMAMWGAPAPQPDHASRACRAGLAMLDRLPKLNANWEGKLGEPLRVGVGINSGPAEVGNTGSSYKYKYGPLGNTVNLASRVQGATKYLKCPLLVTKSTQQLLGEEHATRRICQVRVVNIDEPVDLYEVVRPGNFTWAELQQEYEQALQSFEKKAFGVAAQLLGDLIRRHGRDDPTLLLLSRVAHFLVEDPGDDFDPAWTLPGK